MNLPKGNPYWALVLGFAVAIVALFFGLWLISPRQLAQYMHKKPAVMTQNAVVPMPPSPPPAPPLPDFVVPAK